ncbi:hypothetical protein TWF730_011175 [Orbilia blumenaviensis]|uniref:Uncharacterized protein n=1 Tax=Orbilia blumenaviensis TaxID=1796055 RepID=A0AAV9UKS3_9PEZI
MAETLDHVARVSQTTETPYSTSSSTGQPKDTVILASGNRASGVTNVGSTLTALKTKPKTTIVPPISISTPKSEVLQSAKTEAATNLFGRPSNPDIKENRDLPSSTFYTFNIICPRDIPQLLGDAVGDGAGMSQDPNSYSRFPSVPRSRPYVNRPENYERVSEYFRLLTRACIACANCDPQTGILRLFPPGQCRTNPSAFWSSDDAGRCGNWLGCYCDVEMQDFIMTSDLHLPENREQLFEIYRGLDSIPRWIQRRFPNHRYATLDGLSLAWRRDGWGNQNPEPVGNICGNRVYYPGGPQPVHPRPRERRPFENWFGAGPSRRQDYQWLVGCRGPGLGSLGKPPKAKRDSISGGYLDNKENEGRRVLQATAS